MMGPLLFFSFMYAMGAASAFWWMLTDHADGHITGPGDYEIGPISAEPALQFLFGLLWPLALSIGIAVGLFMLVSKIARGFVALWRYWRAALVARATAILIAKIEAMEPAA